MSTMLRVFPTLKSMKDCLDQNQLEIVIGDFGGRDVLYSLDVNSKIAFKLKELIDHLSSLYRNECLTSSQKGLIFRNITYIAHSLAYLHFKGEVALKKAALHQQILTDVCRLFGNFGRLPHTIELDRLVRRSAQGPFQLVQTISPGRNPASIAFSPNTLLAGITHFNGTSIYKVNVSMGQFSLLGTVPGQSALSLAFSPDGTIAAISSGFGNASNVTFYSVDPSNGVFTPLLNFPKTSQNFASYISFSPDGLLAAVVFSGAVPGIALFAINSTARSVTPLGSFKIGNNPGPIAFSPDSQLALITTGNLESDPGKITAYKVNTSAGTFTALGHFSAGQYPLCAAFSPSGKTVAISNYGSSNISMFYVDTQSGKLTPFQTVQAENGPSALSFSPDGSLAAVVNVLSNTVTVYSVDASGSLEQVQTINAGLLPMAIAFSPQGQLAAVINFNSNNAYIYSVSTGKLT